MKMPAPRFVTPALKSVEAEKCARDMSAVITDKEKRMGVFNAFLSAHPSLKNWEGQAIGSRALFLAQCEANGLSPIDLSPLMAKSTAIENHMATVYPNVI